jgi:DNA-binding transcriptional LysR family regulator
MTLEQLRIFVAAAEREHITRAAEALNLTQSAVSSAIAALEARHAVVLFHRIGRGIELTGAGRMFLDEARAVLSRAAAAERTLAEVSGLERGTLVIHASQTIASYWLPPKLVSFQKAHPKIAIALHAANTAQVAKAVCDGLADIGFAEGPVDDGDLVQQIIASDSLVVAVSRSHPWASSQKITLTDLAQADWVMREAGSGTRAEFEDALQNQGLAIGSLKVVLEVPSNEAARAAVEAGAGATVISELAAEPGLISGRLRVAAFGLPERKFIALRHRERYLSKAAAALLDVIKPAGQS